MNRINFNQIIIGDINKIFTEEQIQTLKNIAAKERQYIIKRYANNKDISIQQRAKERVYRSNQYSDSEKNFIYANILFPDNKKFANMMFNQDENMNYNLKSYQSFIKIIRYLKIKINSKKQIDQEDLRIYKSCIILITKLANYTRRITGVAEFEPIITKINEVLCDDNLMFELNETNQTKKHTL